MEQPTSAHALSHGLSEECLTSRFRYASVADMKTRLNSDGAAARVVQPAPSAVLSCGAAGERSASGVPCAKVTGMNRRADAKSRGGGGIIA